MRRSAAFLCLVLVFATEASARNPRLVTNTFSNACEEGTYSVIGSPDGATISILFDNFSLTGGNRRGIERISCSMQIPLNLPEGYSLGVYKVDYRGYARLAPRQNSILSVDYTLGFRNKSRRHRGRIQGAHDGDFVFSERIGAGFMKRVGCGEAAVLNVAAAIELKTRGEPGEAMVTLDSLDGASQGALVYRVDYKRCGKSRDAQ